MALKRYWRAAIPPAKVRACLPAGFFPPCCYFTHKNRPNTTRGKSVVTPPVWHGHLAGGIAAAEPWHTQDTRAGHMVPHHPGTGTASYQAMSPARHAEGFDAVLGSAWQCHGGGDGDEDASTATRWLVAWQGIGVHKGQGSIPQIVPWGSDKPWGWGRKEMPREIRLNWANALGPPCPSPCAHPHPRPRCSLEIWRLIPALTPPAHP